MGAAKAAEITQMPAITSLAHILEGLALREIKENRTLQLLKICIYKIIFALDVCMKYGLTAKQEHKLQEYEKFVPQGGDH
jgi:hypothetical protein